MPTLPEHVCCSTSPHPEAQETIRDLGEARAERPKTSGHTGLHLPSACAGRLPCLGHPLPRTAQKSAEGFLLLPGWCLWLSRACVSSDDQVLPVKRAGVLKMECGIIFILCLCVLLLPHECVSDRARGQSHRCEGSGQFNVGSGFLSVDPDA